MNKYLPLLPLLLTTLLSAQDNHAGWELAVSLAPDFSQRASAGLLSVETTELDLPLSQRAASFTRDVNGTERTFRGWGAQTEVPVRRTGLPVSVGAALHRRLSGNLRVGLGVTYAHTRYAYAEDPDFRPVGGLLIGNGEVRTSQLLTAARVEYHPLADRRLHPYLGVSAGVGFYHTTSENATATYAGESDNISVSLADVSGTSINSRDAGLTMQYSAGLLYRLTDRFSLGLKGTAGALEGQGSLGTGLRWAL